MFSLGVTGAQVWDSSVLEVRFGIFFNPFLRSALLTPRVPLPPVDSDSQNILTAVLFPPSVAPFGGPRRVRVGTIEGRRLEAGCILGVDILAKGALSLNCAPPLSYFYLSFLLLLL